MLKGITDFLASGRAQVFAGYAASVTPTLWSTAAGTSGPLLYNGSASGGGKGVTAYLLAAGFGLSVASTVAGALGITGAATSAPTSTSAITAVSNLKLNAGAPAPQCSIYSVGTPSNAGSFFLPIGHVHTGATTVDTDDDNFVHLGGLIELSPGYFASIAASAALTSAVLGVSLVWAEVPND